MNKLATIAAMLFIPLTFVIWIGMEEDWFNVSTLDARVLVRVLSVAGLAAWPGMMVVQFHKVQHQKYGSLYILQGFMWIHLLLGYLYSLHPQPPTQMSFVMHSFPLWFIIILPFTGFLMLSKQPELISIAKIILGGVASIMTLLMALYMLNKSPAHTALLLYVSVCTAAVALKSFRAPSTDPDPIAPTNDSPVN